MPNSSQRNKRALVTGATGFIGSNLVKRLINEGWGVDIVVRHGSKLDRLCAQENAITAYEHDGSTDGLIDIVARAKPDTVFHLASLFLAQHKSSDVESLISSNLLFSTQLVEAMVVNGVGNLVNTGTSWQHFHNEDYCPVNLYAATKQAFEDILKYYVEAHGLNVVTLALFDTYGENDPRPKLISLFWNAAIDRTLLHMSPGEQLVDLVHIDDVMAAFSRAADIVEAQKGTQSTYAVSSGKAVPLKVLAEIFQKVTGTTLNINWGGRPYRDREVMIPWTNFKTVPGWSPSVAFENGLLNTRPGCI